MVSKISDLPALKQRPVVAEHYHFISVKAPNEAKDQNIKRLAKSHAVKQALENKRKIERDSAGNFRPSAPQDHSRVLVSKRVRTQTQAASFFYPSMGALDPFQTLAVNSARLQSLLGDYKASQALEPVFSVAETLAFQDFRSVFRTGFVDPALMNAVMLSLELAATGGNINRECLGYQSQTLGYVRQRMNLPDEAISESTIGAILLLAGVDARLGMTSQVQLHIGAVQILLQLCRVNGAHLTRGIKRAIFWQDLNSSILTGSCRIVDHTTFDELRWARESFPPHFFRLPPGFRKISSLLPQEFTEVLQDLSALQSVRDVPNPTKGDEVSMEQINNHIASIQSRLVSLPKHSPVFECCKLAAYICSMVLCCTVWCALVIPSHISFQLLRQFQNAKNDQIWDAHPDLLLWILYTGGAFVPTGNLRSEYIVLIRSNNSNRSRGSYRSLQELHKALKTFIWSEKAFVSQAQALWEESHI